MKESLPEAEKAVMKTCGSLEVICAEAKYILFPNLNKRENLEKTLEMSPS